MTIQQMKTSLKGTMQDKMHQATSFYLANRQNKTRRVGRHESAKPRASSPPSHSRAAGLGVLLTDGSRTNVSGAPRITDARRLATGTPKCTPLMGDHECIRLFMGVLLTIAKDWKHPKCPSGGNWFINPVRPYERVLSSRKTLGDFRDCKLLPVL